MNAEIAHPLSMGLKPVVFECWLKPREGDEHLLTERTKLISARRQDVIAALPDAHDCVVELARILHGRGITLANTGSAESLLQSIGTHIAEDICVLARPDNEEHRLVAAALCFPNRWHLRDKIGRTVTEIHGPVPQYAAQISEKVDRFFTKLHPLRAFTRDNWGLTASPSLYQPDLAPVVKIDDFDSAFLRVEEQSFLKLPVTKAIIFTIRTIVTPWAQVPADTQNMISRAARALTPDWLEYKALEISAPN